MSVFPAVRNGRPPAYTAPSPGWGSFTCRKRLPPSCVVNAVRYRSPVRTVMLVRRDDDAVTVRALPRAACPSSFAGAVVVGRDRGDEPTACERRRGVGL